MERTPSSPADTSAILLGLLSGRSEHTRRELQACREALDILARSLESSVAPGAPDLVATVEHLDQIGRARTQELVDRAVADGRRAVETLQAQIAERTRERDQLAAVLEEARTALRASQELAQKAEAAREKELQTRTEAEARLKRMRSALDHARTESASLHKQLETEAAQRAKLAVALSTAKARMETAEACIETYELGGRQNGDGEAVLSTPAAATEPSEVTNRRVAAMQVLRAATSVGSALDALVDALSIDFSRVALFDVLSDRLQGKHQRGFDVASDISKVVMPLTMDSLLTVAVKRRRVQGFTADSFNAARPAMFDGATAFVLVAPVAIRDEVAAVIYADDAGRVPSTLDAESRVRSVEALIEHAAPVLARFAPDAANPATELGNDVDWLLSELECGYEEDVQAGKVGDDLRAKLKENLERARKLYQQRASAHGPTAGKVLDQRITDVVAARGDAPFGRDLEAITRTPSGDEWGLFDPDKCGMPAIFAKLDELADARKKTDARRKA